MKVVISRKNVFSSLLLLFFALSTIVFVLFSVEIFLSSSRDNYKVQVALNDNLAPRTIVRLMNDISRNYYVNKRDLYSIQFCSKDSLLLKLEKNLGFNIKILDNLNPLKDSFFLKLSKQYSTYHDIKSVIKNLESYSEIFEVDSDYEFIESVDKVIFNVDNISKILFSILFLILCLLAFISIKKSIYNRFFYIKQMKLFGASDSFICSALRIEYFLISFTAANVSGFFIVSVLIFISRYVQILFFSFNFNSLIIALSVPYIISIGIVIFGIRFILFFLNKRAIIK